MRWLFFAPLRPFVGLAAAASLLLNLALLMPSLYTLQVFDRVFASRSGPTLVVLSGLTLAALVFAYAMDVARARALDSAGRALHAAWAPAALEQSLRRAAASRGRADTESLRDVAQLRGFLGSNGLRAAFDAPWLPVYLAFIALMHPLLGAAAALAAVALALLAVATDRLTRSATEATQRLSRRTGRQAEALVRQAEVVVGMGMTAAMVASWRTQQDQLLDAQSRLGLRAARLSAAARVARQGVQMAVLGIGAWLVIGDDASPGIMVAATILLGRALQPVEQLITGWKSCVDAAAAWRRLDRPGALATPDRALALPPPSGRLQCERVSFAPDAARPPLLKGISFTLEAGESLGLVGASGSGKTTLARLLLGLWAPLAGNVRLDGSDITQWPRDALGPHLGYLPQDVSLFAASVAQNIARGAAVDDAAVVAAARRAQAHDLILRLPAGYDTVVGEGGVALSGGQRQRIALARALYGNPRLVVLDEPDAHLDAEGDAALREALGALKAAGTTVVLVGHRAALVARMDKVAVLHEGALQAFGPAAEVLARLQGRNVHALPALQAGSKGALA